MLELKHTEALLSTGPELSLSESNSAKPPEQIAPWVIVWTSCHGCWMPSALALNTEAVVGRVTQDSIVHLSLSGCMNLTLQDHNTMERVSKSWLVLLIHRSLNMGPLN